MEAVPMSFGGGSKQAVADTEIGGLDNEQLSTAQEAVPVPYMAGERKCVAHWISNIYNQKTKEIQADTGKKGGSGKKGGGAGTGTYDYFGSIAAAVCCGQVDELVAIIVDTKQVWALGNVTRQEGDAPYRGTVAGKGEFIFYWGTETQELEADSVLQAGNNSTAEQHPDYKGIAFIELRDFLFGREKVSAPNIEIVVKRKPTQTLVTGSPANLDDSQANLLCCAAELMTNHRFGLNLPVADFKQSSFESTAQALYEQRDIAYGSPLITSQESMRSFLSDIGLMTDLFFVWDKSAALIEAGYWPHGETIDPETLPIITADDLTDPSDLDAESWTGMETGWSVSFFDRDRVYKESSEKYDDISLLEVTGEPNRATINRPYITRREQAKAHAAEWGKSRALPGLSGKISVRKSRAAALTAGSLFRLDIDAEPGGAQLIQIFRITEAVRRKTGSVDLTIEAETNLVPIGYTPVIPGSGDGTGDIDQPEELIYVRPVELPPKLSNTDYGISVLAQRQDGMTIGYQTLYDDAADGEFPNLGNQRTFGVRLALDAAFADDALSADDPAYDPDVDAPVLDAATANDIDLLNLADDLGLLAARNDQLLLMLMEIETAEERAGQIKLDADGFPMLEILSVAAMTVPEVGKRQIQALRGRFGTVQREFSQGAEAWLIYRNGMKIYSHKDFPAAAATQAHCYFKTEPYNAFLSRDISEDGTVDFLFPVSRLFSPKITTTSTPASGYVGVAISVEGSITDQDGDLTFWSVTYRKVGTGVQDEISVAGGPIEATNQHDFKVPIRFFESGTYQVIIRAKDNTTFTDSFVETSFQTAIAVVGDLNPPAAATDLTATSGFMMIWLAWTNPADEDLDYIEIWESGTNDLADAVKIAETGAAFFSHNVSTAADHYYWIRAVDTSGNTGAYNAGQYAGTLGNAKVQIDENDLAPGTVAAQIALINTAIITNAMIADLAASKLTAGDIGAHTINLDGATSILQSKGFVTGETGWRIKGNGQAEFLDMLIRGQIDAGGDLKSSNYIEGTQGWRIKGDGTAEFFNVNIYGTVPAPQVFVGATELTSGNSYQYLASVTLAISAAAGCTAYYRTDGQVPTGDVSEMVPSGGEITIAAESQLRVVAFEDSTSRSSTTFSAGIQVSVPVLLNGLGTSGMYVRTFKTAGSKLLIGLGTTPAAVSSWSNYSAEAFTDIHGNPYGSQYGAWSPGYQTFPNVWFCFSSTTAILGRIGYFYKQTPSAFDANSRMQFNIGSWVKVYSDTAGADLIATYNLTSGFFDTNDYPDIFS
jgi:hypothetical protein